MRRLRNNLVIPTLFLKLLVLVSVKRKSSVVSQWFISRCCRDLQNKVVTDILTRRYLTRASFMHPDVPSKAAVLLRLPSAAGTSYPRSSKNSYQNRSLLLWMLPRWATLSLWPQSDSKDRFAADGCSEGNIWANKWFVLLYWYSVLTCAVAIGG